MNISYTKHAEINIKKRNISNEIIENVILNFAFIEKDKYDDSLIHYIGKIQDKFLRVIVRQINNEKLLIISAFFDRRIKGKI